jgi:nucleotide-binding universal stress UspA family protein
MKKILVPTDFSKNSENALDYAIELAQNEETTIILLHSFYVMYTSPEIPMEFIVEQSSAIQKDADTRLAELSKKTEKYDKIKCETISMEGFIVDSILTLVKKRKIDLVVMGTKGASGIAEMLIGSNTAKVIVKAICPVIAVPEKAKFEGIDKVAYATNYLSSDITMLKKLVEFTKRFKAKIEIIHIADGECQYAYEENLLEKFSKKVKHKITYKAISYQLLFGEDVENKLEQYIKKEAINLLALSARKGNLFERIFRGSLTKKLAYHTSIPLIVFHQKK